jgi:hypothetical protein
MKLKTYQRGELIGIALILASVAAQMFYLDPLRREIEWRLAAFSIQQSGQIQAESAYSNQLAVLKTLNAPAETIQSTEAERDRVIAKFKTADANVSDFVMEKERVEGYLQWIVIALFGLGTLLTGVGRALEMGATDRR